MSQKSLQSKTTSGKFGYEKYVVDNQKFADLKLTLLKDSPIFQWKSGYLHADKQIQKAKSKIAVVSDTILENKGEKVVYIKVKIGGKTGYLPSNIISKPEVKAGGLIHEDSVTKDINRFIQQKDGAIDITLPGDSRIYRNITTAIQMDKRLKTLAGAKGDPKADIILCHDPEKPFDNDTIYVSIKKPGGAAAAQQYGGITEDTIYNHPDVQKFLAISASNIHNDRLEMPIMMEVKDETLIRRAVFGADYKPSTKIYSANNIQLLGYGHPKLTPKGKHFELTFEHTVHVKDSPKRKFINDFAIVLGITHRPGRGFVYKGTRYKGARVGIYPKKYMQGRSLLKEIRS